MVTLWLYDNIITWLHCELNDDSNSIVSCTLPVY